MGTEDTKENAPLAGEAKTELLNSVREQFSGESRAHQGMRLLAALRYFPITTFEARKHLDVMHPAGRVQELRDAGNEIVTLWASEPSEIGKPHRIAKYLLQREANQ